MRYFRLIRDKIVVFFVDYEIHYIASSYAEYQKTQQIPLIRFGILSGMGIVGIVWAVAAWRRWALIFGVFGLYLISAIIFVVQSRYRMPAVPYLCLFAGYGLSRIVESWHTARKRAIGTAGLLFVFTLGSFLCFHGDIEHLDRWQRATKIHYQLHASQAYAQGRYTDAITAIDQALALAPEFVPAIHLKGKCLAFLGDIAGAQYQFQRVISRIPDSPKGYVGMAKTYLMTGDIKLAHTLLMQALVLAPDDRDGREMLEWMQRHDISDH